MELSGSMFEIKSLTKLIDIYLDGSISAIELRDSYSKLFAAIEAGEIDRSLFLIIEDFFEDIDSYSPNWTSKDEANFTYRITEKTLREEAKKSLLAFEKYLAEK